MSTASPSATILKIPGEWWVAARKARVENMALLEFKDHQSRSKVTKEQFLSFRTFVTPMDTQQFESAS
ncbi:uncharacterized protein APUU_21533A [Aspergillus puulaauensis]|uniref:Uncharacterized protein n=1 Tax=Aspergillus puulaauensis TaxID=1220207 RepID=A0A7R8AJG1_9EURO|nr:uncharacterized protein APUU_21533A [Aspergillus puulaauensis]BCS21101.1 hypothetical protein APUU_21533A [Aspergillus puulaauensis]